VQQRSYASKLNISNIKQTGPNILDATNLGWQKIFAANAC